MNFVFGREWPVPAHKTDSGKQEENIFIKREVTWSFYSDESWGAGHPLPLHLLSLNCIPSSEKQLIQRRSPVGHPSGACLSSTSRVTVTGTVPGSVSRCRISSLVDPPPGFTHVKSHTWWQETRKRYCQNKSIKENLRISPPSSRVFLRDNVRVIQ